MENSLKSKINKTAHRRGTEYAERIRISLMQRAQIMWEEGETEEDICFMLDLNPPEFTHGHKTTAQISDEKVSRIADLIGGEL